MITLLNKLRLLRLGQESTEAFIEVVDVLTTLRNTNAEVSVLFDGADTSFNSTVRAINPRHRIMVIDSPPPDINVPMLTRGRPLLLSTSKHGREIAFRSKYMEPFLPDLDMGYQIEMPMFLGTQQPRGAFRVLLDELRMKVTISLMDKDNNRVDGYVKNISKSGVGMQTSNAAVGALRGADNTVNCLIALEGSEEISCKMEIRNIQQQTNGESSTYVGGRMLDISQRDTNLLTRFIENMQRQMFENMVSQS